MATQCDRPLLPSDPPKERFPATHTVIPRDPRRNRNDGAPAQSEVALFIPTSEMYTIESFRGLLQYKNMMEEEYSERENAILTHRVCLEFLSMMPQHGRAGTRRKVQSAAYKKYIATYGSRVAALRENAEGAGGENQAAPIVKYAMPPAPPDEFEDVDSIVFEDEHGDLVEKVRGFILPIFRESHELVHKQFGVDNILGFVYLIAAVDSEYRHEDAAEKLIQKIEDLKEEWRTMSNRSKTPAAETAYLRENRTYGLMTDDGSVTGYELITSDNYSNDIHDSYARLHRDANSGIPLARSKFDVSAFSVENLQTILSRLDPPCLPEQRTWLERDASGVTTLSIPTPQFCWELRTRELAFDELCKRAFPWETQMKLALRNPLKELRVQEALTERHTSAFSTALVSRGIRALPELTVEQQVKRPYTQAAELYRPYVTLIEARIDSIVAIVEEVVARLTRRLRDQPSELAHLRALLAAKRIEYGDLDPLRAAVRSVQDMANAFPKEEIITALEYRKLSEATSLVLDQRVALQERMSEAYKRFMRVGNRDLPQSLRSILDWLQVRDMKLSVTTVAISLSLDPFANFMASTASMYAIAYNLAGTMNPILTMVVSKGEASNQRKNGSAIVMLAGTPGGGKSESMRAIADTHIPGTTQRKSAGGSNKEAIFRKDPEGVTDMMDETPYEWVAKREKLTGDALQRHVTQLELSTTTDQSAIYHMVQQFTDGNTQRPVYLTVQRRILQPAQTFCATNVLPGNPAMRQRVLLVPTRHPPGGTKAAIAKHMFVLHSRVRYVRDVLSENIASMQALVAHYRYAEGMFLVPSVDLELYESMMEIQLPRLHDWGIKQAMLPRVFLAGVSLYCNAVLQYAAWVLLSEASPFAESRKLHIDEDGVPSMDPLVFNLDVVKEMVPHVRSNLAVSVYASMAQFRNIVNETELAIDNLIFERLLYGGTLTPRRLACWVRYVGMMNAVTKPAQDVQRSLDSGKTEDIWPYFMVMPDEARNYNVNKRGDPENMRQVYAFGDIYTRLDWHQTTHETYLRFMEVPPNVPSAPADASSQGNASPQTVNDLFAMAIPWQPSATAGRMRTEGPVMPVMPYGLGRTTIAASQRPSPVRTPARYPAGPAPVQAQEGPTFEYGYFSPPKEFAWSKVHQVLRQFVPHRPGKKMSDFDEEHEDEHIYYGEGRTLEMRVTRISSKEVKLDPNYVRVRVSGYKELRNELLRIMREARNTVSLNCDEQTIDDLLKDKYYNGTRLIHRLKMLDVPPHWSEASPGVTEEYFASAFLESNIEETKEESFMFREDETVDEKGKKITKVYILTALLPGSLERIKAQFLSPYSHSTARPMHVSLGPSMTSIYSVLEMHEIHQTPHVLVLGAPTSRLGGVESDTAHRAVLGSNKKGPIEHLPIMPPGSSYRSVETSVQANVNPVREIHGDLEQICSERWCRRYGVKDDSLPEKVQRRMQDVYLSCNAQDIRRYGLLREAYSTLVANLGRPESGADATSADADAARRATQSSAPPGEDDMDMSPPPYAAASQEPVGATTEDEAELANIDLLANLALEGLAGQDLV